MIDKSNTKQAKNVQIKARMVNAGRTQPKIFQTFIIHAVQQITSTVKYVSYLSQIARNWQENSFHSSNNYEYNTQNTKTTFFLIRSVYILKVRNHGWRTGSRLSREAATTVICLSGGTGLRARG